MKMINRKGKFSAIVLSLLTLITVTLTMTACGKRPESIEITNGPDKTIYLAGEKFDPAGMVVTANYKNGEPEEITDYTYDLTDALKEGDTKVIISYQDKTAEVSIKVFNLVTGIAVKTHATKTAYKSGEIFDPAGMIFTVTYIDGSVKEVAFSDLEATYSKEPLRVGQTEIEINCEGETAKESITVTRGSYVETSIDDTFVSTKTNVKEFVVGSEGLELGEGVFQNNGRTGPETGIKGFDHPNRWITYTFTLQEDGKVDLVWSIAGSHWVDVDTNNPGIPDLGTAVLITIDDNIVIDGRGIALEGGTVEEDNVWWQLHLVVAKDVELSAGTHVFKALTIDDDVTDGYDGINIASLTIYSTSSFAE